MQDIGFLMPNSGSTYNCSIEGNVGRFITSAGEVIFFQTKARLSSGDISNSARLTSLLTPAREALDVKEMDFNQLLQRDLDDHRIAHELVPYILKPQETGPAFFPPILAALLPFESRRPKSELPLLDYQAMQTDPLYPGVKWNMSKVGNVFCLQEYCDASGNLDPKGTGIIRWNDELSKLVIMDGQHRAMALLAIHRTISNSWGASASSGERYRSFYESKINEILSEIRSEGKESKIEILEFPVTICLFPEYTGADKNPHMAARKLFVDVNKEAKPPSESRLILLSDIRLDHVLSREVLNHLRSGAESNVPLYTVEYDNPDPKTSTPRRWNAVTNLEIILRTIDYCCFGPEEIVSDIDKLTVVKGKPNKRIKSAYFRGQMRLQDFMDVSIPDGPRILDRHEIGIDYFPIYNQKARKALHKRFFDSWGKGLILLLSEIAPYRAHIEAVKSIYGAWLGGSIAGDLAKEALFEGVGMFWTLERGHEHWREQVRRAKSLNISCPDESEVSRAWRIVDEVKRAEFEKARCYKYLGKNDDASIASSKAFYSVAITYAAQVGLALTWAMLRHHNPSSDSDLMLSAIIDSVNRSLETSLSHTRDRKLFLSKEGKDPFNLLPKLDAPFAAYFRIFWLELIMVDANHDQLKSAGVDIDIAKNLLDSGRKFYAKKVIADQVQYHQKTGDISLEVAAKRGKDSAIKALARAYSRWFGFQVDVAKDILLRIVDTEEVEDVNGGEEDCETLTI